MRHPARVRHLQPRDQPERRRLARAGRPEQHEELAVRDGQRQPVERLLPDEALADAMEPDLSHAPAPGPAPCRWWRRRNAPAPTSSRAQTASPGAPHEAARRARLEEPLAHLQVHDVVRAERLDELRLHRPEPRPRLARHPHRLRPHAHHHLVPRRQRRPEPRRQLAREGERRPAADRHRGLAALGPDLGRHDVHHRRADELRHEEVDRAADTPPTASPPAASTPSFITATRSARLIASTWSWVT